MRKMCMVLALMAAPASAYAQTAADACAAVPAGTTFVVMASTPAKVLWVMDSTVPVNPPGDMTLVTQRIDGFYIRINAQPRIDTGRITPATCPAGGPHAGKWGFMFVLPAAVPVGKHNISVQGYNFALNADGTPTTTRQEGVATSIPFTSVEPAQVGPPLAPVNVSIVK